MSAFPTSNHFLEPVALSTAYPTPDPARRDDDLRSTAMFDYVLHIACVLLSLGLLSVIPVIVNYMKRPSARGTIYESHFTWMIRSAWWTLGWLVVTGVLAVFSLGIFAFLMSIPLIWFTYRMIRGVLALREGRPMPVPIGSPGYMPLGQGGPVSRVP